MKERTAKKKKRQERRGRRKARSVLGKPGVKGGGSRRIFKGIIFQNEAVLQHPRGGTIERPEFSTYRVSS